VDFRRIWNKSGEYGETLHKLEMKRTYDSQTDVNQSQHELSDEESQ